MSSQTAVEEEQIYTDEFLGDRSWNGRERNQLLLNLGDGTFVEAGVALGLARLEDGRGLAAADFDHDGDVDFVINNYRAPATYLVNRLGDTRRWLALRLQGSGKNRDAIGATLWIEAGDLLQTRVVGAGHGYAAQYSLEQLVGLGERTEVDRVRVRWPSGRSEAFGPFAAGQRVRLVEGTGRPLAAHEARAAAGARAGDEPSAARAPSPLRLALGLLVLAIGVGVLAAGGRPGRRGA